MAFNITYQESVINALASSNLVSRVGLTFHYISGRCNGFVVLPPCENIKYSSKWEYSILEFESPQKGFYPYFIDRPMTNLELLKAQKRIDEITKAFLSRVIWGNNKIRTKMDIYEIAKSIGKKKIGEACSAYICSQTNNLWVVGTKSSFLYEKFESREAAEEELRVVQDAIKFIIETNKRM